MPLHLTTTARHDLRANLEDHPGIHRVLVDDDEPVLWLICDADADPSPLQAAAHDALGAVGIDPDEVRVETVLHGRQPTRRRVRFERVERLPDDSGGVRVRVTLEWRDRSYTGTAAGRVDTGPVELRTGATAALRALEALIGHSLELRLTGIKQVRAFDEDLMVVSLYRSAPPTRHFVGTVVVSTTPLVSSVLVVLNAVNRLLGNYLTITD